MKTKELIALLSIEDQEAEVRVEVWVPDFEQWLTVPAWNVTEDSAHNVTLSLENYHPLEREDNFLFVAMPVNYEVTKEN